MGSLALAVAVAGGCALSADVPTDLPNVVGPAPLRRLSNTEYLHALHDLFPSQVHALPLLPNDSSNSGFDNETEAQQPSDVRIARYEAIANLYAEDATRTTEAIQKLAHCTEWQTPTSAEACRAKFIESVGGFVFRRPLTSDERDRLTLRFQAWTTAVDFEAAVRLTLSAMLQSPQFLYRAEPLPDLPSLPSAPLAVEPYAMASRLSFFLWQSIPDNFLLEAASKNELGSTDQVRAQATRMLNDDRARRVFWNFHRQWLGLDRVLGEEHSVRTPQVDPMWTSKSQYAASEESRYFVENTMMSTGTLRELLMSRRAWVNDEMARTYDLAPTGDASAWREVLLPDANRAGILTRAAFLAGFSHRGATSPPIRGSAIQLHWLCKLPSAPPPGVDLSMPKALPEDGAQTNRTLFERRTAPGPCQGCHIGLNGFGFGFENYTAAGAFQTQEQGLPIDARGTVVGTDVDRPFDGAVDLSAALEGSEAVRSCVTRQWMTYALGRAPATEERALEDALKTRLTSSGGNLRELLVDIVTSPTFRLQPIKEK